MFLLERAMSVEDKIKRAEEIYNRRKENEYRNTARVNVEAKKNTKVLKKMRNQIIVCLIIYGVFYFVLNSNYAFSEDIRKKANEILSYDISLQQLYTEACNLWNSLSETIEENTNENIEGLEDTMDQSNDIEETTENTEENTNDESIGGSTEENIISQDGTGQENSDEAENLTEEEQMQKDAEKIKNTISFIQPVQGVITSTFGWRNPTVSTVSKYHTGLDIGASIGTQIISATDGKIIKASSEGDYGNHLQVEINGITIIYAHCSVLCVNEGDEITQGQKIAEVGSTGNSTGPHLHFEIRKDGRYVDPQLILEFK